MRFTAPDSDEEASTVTPGTFNAWRSPAPIKNGGPSRAPYTSSISTAKPRSALGKRMKSYAEDSDSDSEVDRAIDSEDEVDLVGLSESWDEVKKTPSGSKAAARKAGVNAAVSRVRKENFSAMMEIIETEPNQYEAWVKITEEAAWHEGHKIAHSRRAELREIALNAKAEMKQSHDLQAAQDAEEMRKMLEGLAIQQTKEEEEARRIFKEREAKLWADIDAALKHTQELEAQKRKLDGAQQRLAAAEAQKRKDAAAAAEAAVQEEAASKARAVAEKARADALAKAQKEQAEERKREEEAAKRKVADQRGLPGAEWKAYVNKQRWMKAEVIEKAKAEGGVRAGLRKGMRLMTRGLGQVVNTRESVVRVTNDIAAILNDQLPAPPSTSSPMLLSHPPPIAYSYLLSHLAKSIIKQAESEVSAKQDAAFPLARIVVGLLLRGHAAFGEVLFARFVKKCPWIVPFYPSRQPDQPRAEYEKSTGRSTDEGLADYVSRMAGISTLYFAILQTPLGSLMRYIPSPPSPDELLVLVIPPLRLPAAWTWISFALRDSMPSLPPIATILASWIEVCGFAVGRTFGLTQLTKVYEAIKKEGLGEGTIKGDSEAARQRLAMLLDGPWQDHEPQGRHWE